MAKKVRSSLIEEFFELADPWILLKTHKFRYSLLTFGYSFW
jgi:hypothetical protein